MWAQRYLMKVTTGLPIYGRPLGKHVPRDEIGDQQWQNARRDPQEYGRESQDIWIDPECFTQPANYTGDAYVLR